MMFGMELARLSSMMGGMRVVALCHVGVVAGLLDIVVLMVLGGMTMVLGGLLMMMSGLVVVFDHLVF